MPTTKKLLNRLEQASGSKRKPEDVESEDYESLPPAKIVKIDMKYDPKLKIWYAGKHPSSVVAVKQEPPIILNETTALHFFGHNRARRMESFLAKKEQEAEKLPTDSVHAMQTRSKSLR